MSRVWWNACDLMLVKPRDVDQMDEEFREFRRKVLAVRDKCHIDI